MAVDVGPGTPKAADLYGDDLLKLNEISAANDEIRNADGRDRVANLRRCRTAVASLRKSDLMSWIIREPQKLLKKIIRTPRASEEHAQAPDPGDGGCANTRQSLPRTPRRRQEHGRYPGYRCGDARAAGGGSVVVGRGPTRISPLRARAGRGRRWSTPTNVRQVTVYGKKTRFSPPRCGAAEIYSSLCVCWTNFAPSIANSTTPAVEMR